MIAYADGQPYLINKEDFARLPSRVCINSDPTGYLRFSSNGTLLHRWLLGLEVGDPRVGDHINKNIYDNRMRNLRIVSATESNLNRRPWNKAGMPSGIVLTAGGKFQSKLSYERKRYYLGTFDNLEDAVAARELKLRELRKISGAR